jgi:PAS domain S-box-containing protein
MTPESQGLLDRLPCGWLRMERSGILLSVNATLCHMLGMEAADLVGRHLDSLLTPASRVLYQTYLQPLLLLHGRVEEFSLAFCDAQGHTVEALVYSAGVGSGTAPTDAKQLELVVARLRRRSDIEQELLRVKRAADQSPGMIYQYLQRRDGSRHLLYTSEAIRRLYGVSPQQAHDSVERLLGLFDEKTGTSIANGLRDAADASKEGRAIFEVKLPGQAPRWHEAQAAPSHLVAGGRLPARPARAVQQTAAASGAGQLAEQCRQIQPRGWHRVHEHKSPRAGRASQRV